MVWITCIDSIDTLFIYKTNINIAFNYSGNINIFYIVVP